ncbi:MAG TPA: PEGA domain-containing protein [Fibrobacteria bacterium]|nr:PEGA domain-containing protein [Fibrobacteria bacterium]
MSARLADGEVFDSAKLKNTVRFLIENDMRNVVIDLGNLEYLYSDTINAFIASNRHMLEVSGRIAILTEHPKVQDILKRAGLDNIMRIYRSEAEMIADSKEILRQTSSYRIEELQKISTQPPEAPPVPKTEFDEFKAEMGQRLGSKLDNNELPQYQLGVPAPPAFTPAPASREPETAYPSFNPPGFGSPQIPETPAQGFPQSQPAPAYNFNNQAFGGMANTTPTFPGQNNQNFNQSPPNFDFPTVQLPVGQFGNLNQPQAPAAPPQGGPNGTPPQDADTDELADPRQRKPSQERMRSPNARKQQGRRVGGREFPGQDEESVQERPVSEERAPEPPSRENDKFDAYNNPPPAGPANLTEEARFPAKLIILVLLIALGVGLYFFLSSKSARQPETPALETTPSQPVTPAPETAPVTPAAPTAQEPVTPAAPAAPTPPGAPETPAAPSAPQAVKPPVAEVPKEIPKPPTPKPEPRPPKVALHKPPKKERVEKPAPAAAPSDEPAPAAVPRGSLHITSNPPGAEVLINFSKKGTTPTDVVLGNNSNKIIVRLAGYKRFETTLPKNHPDRELEVNLEKEEGAEPPAKPVAAKPEPKPEPKAEPKPETKPTAYEEPEDLPMKAQAPVRAKDPEPEPAAPKPKVAEAPTPGDGPIGIIFLSSSPARADIIIDGKNTGKKTPAKLELPSGQHRIEMSKSGQKSTVDQMVNEGKNKALHLTLQ